MTLRGFENVGGRRRLKHAWYLQHSFPFCDAAMALQARFWWFQKTFLAMYALASVTSMTWTPTSRILSAPVAMSSVRNT